MKVMGTGSRSMVTDPNAKNIYNTLERYITILHEEDPDLVLITGMAEGWDEAIAKVAFRNHIPYICAIPNKGYGEYYWGKHSLLGVNRMNTFNQLVNGAAEVVYVCAGIYENGVHANFVRNQWMVDNCDSALVYNPQSSGTRDAVARLTTAGKPYEVFPFTKQLSF